jgi:hypothetical protein
MPSEQNEDDSDDDEPPPLNNFHDSDSEDEAEPRPRAPPAGAPVAGPSSKKKRSGCKHRKKRGAAGSLGVGSPADTVRAEPPERHVKVSEMRHEDKVIMTKDTLEDALDAEVAADYHSEGQQVVPSAGGVVGTIFYNHNNFFVHVAVVVRCCCTTDAAS